MRIIRVFHCVALSLMISCGGSVSEPGQPDPDNHEQIVLESIPYSALGTTRLTFARDDHPRHGVISLDGSAGRAEITYSVFGPLVAASPVSTKLAYLGWPAGGGGQFYDVYVRDWNAKTGVAFGGASANRGNPSWTPDGSRIVFTEADASLNGVFTRIFSQPPVPGSTGRQLLWSATKPCERVLQPRQNAAGTLVFGYSLTASPCSYSSNIARATPGGAAQIIYSSSGQDVQNILSPTWSPSGAEIAFLETGILSFVLKIMSADGSNVRPIGSYPHLTSNTELSASMCWSRDGSRVFFSRWDAESTSHIYSVAISDGAVTQITSGLNVRDASLSCS